MEQLIALVKKKPHWLDNEGYWRILQILRVAATIPGIIFLILLIGESSGRSFIHYLPFYFLVLAIIFASFFGAHLIAWAVAWVVAGFSETKKS
jgi:hypothetical protein